jgi:hypothetical protein
VYIPPMDGGAPGFEIGEETETDAGWAYEVIFYAGGGAPSTHRVGLSWMDHDLLSRGLRPPQATLEAVCRVLFGHPDVLDTAPARFDVATVRRRISGFDEAVREAMGDAD